MLDLVRRNSGRSKLRPQSLLQKKDTTNGDCQDGRLYQAHPVTCASHTWKFLRVRPKSLRYTHFISVFIFATYYYCAIFVWQYVECDCYFIMCDCLLLQWCCFFVVPRERRFTDAVFAARPQDNGQSARLAAASSSPSTIQRQGYPQGKLTTKRYNVSPYKATAAHLAHCMHFL